MPLTPQRLTGSKRYSDAWRAINELIRSDGSWSGRERNKCFRNAGDGTFQDVSYVAGMDFAGDGRSMAVLDYDNDGDLDLILKFRTQPQLRIMRNDADVVGPNRSLLVELAGAESNRDAVGARAVLETSKRKLAREVYSGAGYLAQSSRRLHFGLESGEVPETLEVRWPGGARQSFAELPDSGLIRISEGAAAFTRMTLSKPAKLEPEPSRRTEIEGTWLVDPLPAPPFKVTGLDGADYELSAYKGRKVLLNFWATWCPPCRAELQDFRENSEAFREAGVELLTISVDEPAEREKVRKFVDELRLPFPVLLANDPVVAAYSVLNRLLFNRRRDLGIPTSFLINEQGWIVKAYVGEAHASGVIEDASTMRGDPLPFSGKRYTPAPRRNYLDMATAMAERGLRAEARYLFQTALASGQGGYEIYTNLASLLLDMGEMEESEKLFRASLKVQPKQIEAMTNLGILLVRQKRPEEALRSLDEVRKLYPDDAYVLNAMGNALFQLDNLPEAEKLFREAVRIEPDSAEYHFNLGAALATMGRNFGALEQFEEARRFGRNTVELSNNLGILYVETGQSAKALAEFEKAVLSDPANYGTHVNLALYHWQAGNLEEGRTWIEKAQRLDPANPAAFLLEAQTLIQMGETAGAKAILGKLLEANPDLQPARELLQGLQ